jgi:transposase
LDNFTTLAKFISHHADEFEELFEQILLVCHEQGLLGKKRDKLKRLLHHHIKPSFQIHFSQEFQE